MWRIWRAPNNASKWQMGFNSALKGLIIPQNKNCTLLGYYTASSGNSLLMFWDNQTVPSSRVISLILKGQTLKMGLITLEGGNDKLS